LSNYRTVPLITAAFNIIIATFGVMKPRHDAAAAYVHSAMHVTMHTAHPDLWSTVHVRLPTQLISWATDCASCDRVLNCLAEHMPGRFVCPVCWGHAVGLRAADLHSLASDGRGGPPNPS
jgi:hypothetical protein